MADQLISDPSKGAVFSDDQVYRYMLWRKWDPSSESLGWLMLNPSTADADRDDPTIRRCIDFAKRDGFGGIVVANLFALRSTDPSHLWTHPDPIGPENDDWIIRVGSMCCGNLVAAWGGTGHSKAWPRIEAVEHLCAEQAIQLDALGVTQHGQPRHPLFVLRTATRDRYS
jgi:hypothetical protein